jgi:PAS domain S-box-containing protein
MKDSLRESGSELLGQIPWGTHLCQFYVSKQDLLDILVPYFAAGLTNNEFCMWITAAPLEPVEAERALSQTVPDWEERKRRGQIEILRWDQWYIRSGRFDAAAVLNGWVEKETWALAQGYAGLRLAGQTSWLEDKDWRAFLDYERTADSVIGEHRIMAISPYSLDRCALPGIIEVIDTHESALVKTRGAWRKVAGGRRRAEAALKSAETWYRMLFDEARDSIIVLELPPDAPSFIRDANAAALKLHGYSRDELIGKPLSLLDAEEVPASLIAERSRRLQGPKGAAFEVRHRRKDGSVFAAEAAVRGMTLGGKLFAIDVSRDITERKRAAEALKEAQAFTESALDVLLDIFFVFDSQGKFLSWNAAVRRMTGYNDEEIAAMKPADFFAADDRPRVSAAIGRVFREGAASVTADYLTKDGRRIPYEIAGSVLKDSKGNTIGCAGTGRDLTERKRGEKELQDSLRRQIAINELRRISLAPLPLPRKLTQMLECMLATPWFELESKGCVFIKEGSVLNMAAQVGLSGPVLAACGRLPLGRCLCGRAAQTGEEVAATGLDERHELSYEGIHPHGHICLPLKGGGDVLGVLNLYTKLGEPPDPGQQVFARAAAGVFAGVLFLARSEEKSLQSQKMEVVGRLAGGVAHDFNNLLTAIKGCGEFVRDALTAEDPKRADVVEILNATDRASALTRQLLAFSRRQILEPQEVDINKVVGEMANMLRRLIGENMKLVIEPAPAPCLAKVDPGQTEQVIMNLAVNARDSMPKGGTIAVETEIVTLDEAFFTAHPDLRRGPMVCLRVRDTGCGMSDEVKSHLFEPFFTTKGKGKGTGLGLSTVLGIIKQSGGEIEMESAPGRGTTFRIYFPQIETATPGKEKAKEKEAPARGHETVLLTEDDDILRRVGERILVEDGYTVLTAADGQEALKMLEQHAKPVDLLVTDVVMPGMNGRELAREIARRNLAPRTLFISGYTDDSIVRHGVLEPGLAFLYKPFSPEGLLRKLREVLDGPADQAKA